MIPVADVVIVGGGPSGLYASRLLANRGVSTVVLEEHDGVGVPVHCTGILGAEAFDEFDIPRSAILNELRTVTFFSPSGKTVSYTTSTPEALVIDRSTFDRVLSSDAERAGVRILKRTRATRVETTNDGAFVHLASGDVVKGRVCIVACGATYGVQLQLGLGMPRFYLKSAQVEAKAGCVHDVEVHLGSDVAPRGFGWVAPVFRSDGMYCRIGLMCDGDLESSFRRFLDKVSDRWCVSTSGVRPRIKILPLGAIQKTVLDRIIVIGDAAGCVKPTTGGGIYYSLLSAHFAGETVERALKIGDFSHNTLQEYEARWQNRIGREIDAQQTLRMLVDRFSDADFEDLIDLARIDGLLPLVRKTARFNEYREFISALLEHPDVRKILFRRITASII